MVACDEIEKDFYLQGSSELVPEHNPAVLFGGWARLQVFWKVPIGLKFDPFVGIVELSNFNPKNYKS